jgi:hypothetical protein
VTTRDASMVVVKAAVSVPLAKDTVPVAELRFTD